MMLKKHSGNNRRGGCTRFVLSVRGLALATLLACLGVFSLNVLTLHSNVASSLSSSQQHGMQLSTGTAVAAEYEQQTVDEKERRLQEEACAHMKSVRDIQTCYPPSFLRPFNHDSCNEDAIDDWSSVQRCLTGRRRFRESEKQQQDNIITDDEPPFVIHIIGERHSGTKFIMQQLQQCFLHQPSAARFIRKVHRDFVRVKHFFQPALRGKDFRRHIVVVIVRNATDWVAAMHAKPYHSPFHVQSFTTNINDNVVGQKKSQQHEVVPLPWQDFVSRPWTTHRSQADEKLERQYEVDPQSRYKMSCQEMFMFDQVVPCEMDETSYSYIPPERRRGFVPLYEMRRDGTGQPFDNILELRADKIVNFCLQVPMWFNLGGFAIVRYEDLLQKGTRFVMEQIAEMVGMSSLPAACNPKGPQPERLGVRAIPEGLAQWVEDHIDIDREKLIGYR